MAKMILSMVKNSRGVTVVAALLMMALLSFIGIAAVMTSSIETKISGNQKSDKEAFYVAESGSAVALKWLDTQYPPFVGTYQATQSLGECTYTYTIEFQEVRPTPGFSDEFQDYYYKVTTVGTNPQGSQSVIEVIISHPYQIGGAY